MWLKFDGNTAVIKLEGWKKLKRLEEFTVNMWIHFVEDNGKLYINGKEIKEV